MPKKRSSNLAKYTTKRGRPSIVTGEPTKKFSVTVPLSMYDAIGKAAEARNGTRALVVREALDLMLGDYR